MAQSEFDAELERRLQLLEDPSYEEPARRDLSGVELALLAGTVVLVIVLAYLWGYPA